jgi:glycosyltransferase involved in cell wall biosynthesis
VAEGPEVAVIVGAYRRERFLRSALRSVLDQTLPRERYEILVTKDFANDEIDHFLKEQRIPALLDDDPRIGSWLGRAVAATRAPYLAFLDDDDEFEPDRLSHALEVLHADPGLGFYRNRVRVIDENGAPVPREAWRFYAVDDYLDRRGPVTVPPRDKAGLAELGLEKTRVSFNSSTMIVRRELLEGELGAVFARTQLPDVALFVLAALSRFGLYLDDRRLTRYRSYPGKVTHRVPWLRHACEAYRDLSSLARAHQNDDFARRLVRTSEHYDRVYRTGTIVEKVGAGAKRREVAQLAMEYLRFLGQHPAERAFALDVWAAELYAASYLLAPGVTRRVSVRQEARRRP